MRRYFGCIYCNRQHRATHSVRRTSTMLRGGVSVLSRKSFTQVMLTPDQWTAIQDQRVGPCCGGALIVFLAIDSIAPLIPCGAQAPCLVGGVSGFSRKAFTLVMLTPAKWTAFQDQRVGPCCRRALIVFLAIDSIARLIPCGAQAPCIVGGVSEIGRAHV